MNPDPDSLALVCLKLLGIVVLVLFNGFFVAAEFSLVKLRATQVDALILKGQRRARVARRLINNLEACLSATQIGITICGVATGATVKPVFQALLRPLFNHLGMHSEGARTTVEFLVGFLVSTFLLIVIGELVPKSLAIRKTLTTSLWVATPLEWFYRLAFPFIWVLNHSAQWFLAKVGIQPVNEAEQGHSEEELRLLLTSSQRHGAGNVSRDLVLNALDIRHRIVREVMQPRREMVVLDTHAGIAECLTVAEKTRYSRFPLCENGDVDQTRGVVHIKDLYAMRIKARTGADLLPAARKIIYVPETARIEKLLHLLLERRLHLAIVVDEYGGTLGLVTLENILEELVGQIQDEFDQEKPLVIPTGDNAWELQGALPLHELGDIVGQTLREEGITTTSGFVTHRLGGFPKEGDTLALGAFELRVSETDGTRVTRLELVKRQTPPQESAVSGT